MTQRYDELGKINDGVGKIKFLTPRVKLKLAGFAVCVAGLLSFEMYHHVGSPGKNPSTSGAIQKGAGSQVKSTESLDKKTNPTK